CGAAAGKMACQRLPRLWLAAAEPDCGACGGVCEGLRRAGNSCILNHHRATPDSTSFAYSAGSRGSTGNPPAAAGRTIGYQQADRADAGCAATAQPLCGCCAAHLFAECGWQRVGHIACDAAGNSGPLAVPQLAAWSGAAGAAVEFWAGLCLLAGAGLVRRFILAAAFSDPACPA